MKNNFQILAIFLLLFILTSCGDILEEDPQTFYNEEAVFGTEAGVESAVNGLYSSFTHYDYYGAAWHNLLMPTSGKFFSTQRANVDATSLNTTPSNVNLRQLWAQAFKTINVANTIIDNLENTDLELNNKEVSLGNAYFIRAATYFDLVRLFGGVPLKTKGATLEDIHQPRAGRSEILDLITADLELAKNLLPEPDEERLGYPNRLVASVYLAKLYMTLAGEDGGDAGLWAKAYEEAIVVYNSQYYQLTPTYAELFDLENENTTESIFELQYGHTGGTRNSDIARLYTPSNSIFVPANVTTFGRIRPNKETFDAHLEQYSDDPRIAATFVFDNYDKNDGGTQNIYPTNNTGNQGFAIIRKWIDPTYNGTTTAKNYILIRYADVLLMLAEIENEISGPDAAYGYVNQVLARARDIDGDGISDTVEPSEWSAMSQETFRERIIKERQYELLSEGHTWFDTRRRGYEYFLKEVVENHNNHPTQDPDTDFVYPVSVKNMLLPIPLAEISGNQQIGPGDQNPGY